MRDQLLIDPMNWREPVFRVLERWIHGIPEGAAKLNQDVASGTHAGKAAQMNPRFQQPGSDLKVLRTLLQSIKTDLVDQIPIGPLEISFPYTLLQNRIILAPRLHDAIIGAFIAQQLA